MKHKGFAEQLLVLDMPLLRSHIKDVRAYHQAVTCFNNSVKGSDYEALLTYFAS